METGRAASEKAQAQVPLDRTLSYRLHLLHKLTDRESQRAYLEDAGLPLGEGRCLAAIGTFEPLSIQDLAHCANLDKGQASRAAQSLVELGLVRKQVSARDARGVVLTLTPRGHRKWQAVMAVVERRNAEIFGCLSAAERVLLSDLFDRLVAHARESGTGNSADTE